MPLPYTFGCNDKVCWYAKCEKPERLNCEAYNWVLREFRRLKQEGRLKHWKEEDLRRLED